VLAVGADRPDAARPGGPDVAKLIALHPVGGREVVDTFDRLAYAIEEQGFAGQ